MLVQMPVILLAVQLQLIEELMAMMIAKMWTPVPTVNVALAVAALVAARICSLAISSMPMDI